MHDFNIENKFWHGLGRNRFAKYFNQLKILEMSNLEDDGLCLELGVFKATSLIRLAHHLRNLQPNKLIYGFDVFGEFPQSSDPSSQDRLFLDDWKRTAGDGLKKEQVEEILKDIDVENVRLIEGDIRVTLKDFLEKMKRPISFVI